MLFFKKIPDHQKTTHNSDTEYFLGRVQLVPRQKTEFLKNVGFTPKKLDVLAQNIHFCPKICIFGQMQIPPAHLVPCWLVGC